MLLETVMTPPTAAGYATRDVARLLDLPESRLRTWVRDGLLEPARGERNEYRFTFPDLVLLRTARELEEAGLSARRVREALEGLKQQLPRGRTLAGVRVSVQGDAVVVHSGAESWNAESGQRLLGFEVAELAAKVAPLAVRAARAAQQRKDLAAEDWFELGLELEAAAPEEAREAYRRALALAPAHGEANLNLGRLLHEQGDLEAAERHYLAALDADPLDATAAFNLGVALQDAGRRGEAIDAYRRALELDAACADAYYNLAAIYEELGDRAVAIQNLKAYRTLTRA